MQSNLQDSDIVHPDYRVWYRNSARGRWQERPVLSAAVDMWRPRLVGHVIVPTEGPVFLKITSRHPLEKVQIRPSKGNSKPIHRDASLRLTLQPNTIVTLQWNRDPGKCLHLVTRPIATPVKKKEKMRILHFGPGIHVVPGGILELTSHQILHLEEGAFLRASVVCRNAKNITIRGLGTIDLLQDCPDDPPSETAAKQAAVKIVHCRNVRIEGITIRNPSHYGILLGESHGIRIRHVSVYTHCRWGDGIDSMACTDVRVKHAFVRTSDDCLAIYADRGSSKGAAHNHRYRHCTLWADVAHPVMIGVHGKQKPPGRVIENLKFEHITILRHCEASPMYQGCLTLNPGDNNTIRDVLFSDILIEDTKAPRLLDVRILFNPAYNPMPGKAIHDILFRRIDYRGNPDIPSVIEGYDRHRRVRDIRIKDLLINGQPCKDLPNATINQWAENPVVKSSRRKHPNAEHPK